MLRTELETHIDGTTVCSPVGDIDAFSVCQFRQAMADLSPCSKLVIDMSRVYFVDSAGLAALISGIRRAREHGSDVTIVCSRHGLNRLLHRIGLDQIVTVSDDFAEAMSALRVDATPAS